MIIGINDHDLDLEHRLNVTMLKSVYCYIRLALLFHFYIISMNWKVPALNFVTTKVSHKSVTLTLTLTLILNTNCECYKVCIRLFWLIDIKWMKKTLKKTCLSLLHEELWYIFEKNRWPSKLRSRDTQIQFPKLESWKIVFYYASRFQTTPNLCL